MKASSRVIWGGLLGVGLLVAGGSITSQRVLSSDSKPRIVLRMEADPVPESPGVGEGPGIWSGLWNLSLKLPQSSPRIASPLVGVVALLMQGLAYGAVTIPAGVTPYPDQPKLDVAWSLQGLADEEEEGGEAADVEEWGG